MDKAPALAFRTTIVQIGVPAGRMEKGSTTGETDRPGSRKSFGGVDLQPVMLSQPATLEDLGKLGRAERMLRARNAGATMWTMREWDDQPC